MKRFVSMLLVLLTVFALTSVLPVRALAADDTAVPAAAEETESSAKSAKAIAAAIVVGLAAAAGAIGMAMAISKSAESMARQPEMANKINSAMMLGLVFIETAIIYALIVAILVIFVL